MKSTEVEVGKFYLAKWCLDHGRPRHECELQILEKNEKEIIYCWLDGWSAENPPTTAHDDEKEFIYCEILNSPLAKALREE